MTTDAPYHLIADREPSQFPFAAVQSYRHCFAVDWRESDMDIVERFLTAAGLPAHDAKVRWEAAPGHSVLTRNGLDHAVPLEGRSAQDAMLRVLATVYRATHGIRSLSHVALGDTAYFVVETPSDWAGFEIQNPLVRWFFTPIERLPDLFTTSFDDLAEAARSFAKARFVHEPAV
jgi:hypothetical protein